MTLREVVNRVVALIAECPRLEGEVRADAAREGRLLVAGVLHLSPGSLAQRLVAEPALRAGEAERIEAALHRRLRGEPLAYAVGEAAFRDLVLQVDARVLIPRPETEVVVEEALRATAATPGGLAVDIGTGSGAIALALATEGRFDRVLATDVSADALAVAEGNARRLQAAGVAMAPVSFRCGADLAPLAGGDDGLPAAGADPGGPSGAPFDARPIASARVIVSNPPYIAYDEAAVLPPSVRDWEPALALFAANGGLARYEVLVRDARRCLEPGGWLVLELDASRAAPVAAMAAQAGYEDVEVKQDLAGRDRVLVARAPA